MWWIASIVSAKTLREFRKLAPSKLTLSSEVVEQLKADNTKMVDSISDLIHREGKLVRRNAINAGLSSAATGPRTFSVREVIGRKKLKGLSHRFLQVTLWCDYSNAPVPVLNGFQGQGDCDGTLILPVPKDWWDSIKGSVPAVAIVARIACVVAGGAPVVPSLKQR